VFLVLVSLYGESDGHLSLEPSNTIISLLPVSEILRLDNVMREWT